MRTNQKIANKSLLKFTFFILLFIFSNQVKAQKIVFEQDFNLRNNVFTDKMPFAGLLYDSVSKQRVLIASNMKNMVIYLLDKDWKIVKQFETEILKKSNLCKSLYKLVMLQKKDNVWIAITALTFGGGWTKETIDFGANTIKVDEGFMDNNEIEDSNDFVDGENKTLMVLKKGDKESIYFTTIDKNFGIKKQA